MSWGGGKGSDRSAVEGAEGEGGTKVKGKKGLKLRAEEVPKRVNIRFSRLKEIDLMVRGEELRTRGGGGGLRTGGIGKGKGRL